MDQYLLHVNLVKRFCFCFTCKWVIGKNSSNFKLVADNNMLYVIHRISIPTSQFMNNSV